MNMVEGANKTYRKFPGAMPAEDLQICIVTWVHTVLLGSVNSIFFFLICTCFGLPPSNKKWLLSYYYVLGIVVKSSWKLKWWDPSSHSMRCQEWNLWMMKGRGWGVAHGRGRLRGHMVRRSCQNCLMQVQPVVCRCFHYRGTLIKAPFVWTEQLSERRCLAVFWVHQPYAFTAMVNVASPYLSTPDTCFESVSFQTKPPISARMNWISVLIK